MIDCHAHLIPPAALQYLREDAAGQIGFVEDADSYRFHFSGLPTSPPAPRCISDIESAEIWQRERGIALQVFSPWTDLFGYTLDEQLADRWTRVLNEGMAAAVCDRANARALGSISIQHPALAVRQIAEIADLGLIGVMIGTAAPEITLDDRSLGVVWDALIRYEMPAFIHPIFLNADPVLQAYGLANVVGRSNATTVAVARLLFGGVLERHPRLKLIVARRRVDPVPPGADATRS